MKRALLAVLSAALLLSLCGCHWDLFGHSHRAAPATTAPTVAVPNVVGATQAAAGNTLTAAGLAVGSVSQGASATVPSGDVISESPAAGTQVASGTSVDLVVSTGPAPVSVPNVVGDTQAAATSALTGAGLSVGTITLASSATVAAGDVISQSPAAATSVAAGSAVSLTVSTGAAVAGSESILHSFGAAGDGSEPMAGLILGPDGNYYGTTEQGGVNGVGTVYRLTPAGVETVIYSFGASAQDGTYPSAGLVLGADGNFYGTTSSGGALFSANGSFGGTVFKITPAGVETILYTFGASLNDGYNTAAGLIQGTDGNFYGTNTAGGANNFGTLFKLTPAGVETVLHSFFATLTDGYDPTGSLIEGADGNLYGLTEAGGATNGAGGGTLYSVTPAGVESILYVFGIAANDGSVPTGVVQGGDGNFYGVCKDGGANGNGTLFKVTPAGIEAILYSFGGSAGDGVQPASIIVGSDGNFYGATGAGGTGGDGTVFSVTPAGVETVLYSFTGGPADGKYPLSSLLQVSAGMFYGTTTQGGANNNGGTVFSITTGN